MPLKWAIYAGLAVVCVIFIVLSGKVRNTLFVIMVMALQANVTFGTWERTSYVGESGPINFFIPLVVLPAVALIFWQLIMSGLGSERFTVTFGFLTLPALLFMLTSFATMFYAPEQRRVIYNLQVPLYGCLVCVATANMLRTREDIAKVLSLLLIILGMQCVVYFIQNGTGIGFSLTGQVVSRAGDGLQRHGGTVSMNAKGFAMFISPLTLIALSIFVSTREPARRRNSAILVMMGIASIVLTFTRAAWAGFMMGAVLVMIIGLLRGRVVLSRVAMFGGVAVMTVLGFLPMILIRLADDRLAAYEERAFLMRVAWRIIDANWLGGIGAGAYPLLMRDYVSPMELSTRWLYVVHNAYLLRWAETGLFGLLSFVFLLLVAFRTAVYCTRSRDAATFALGLGWSAGLLHLCWEMWWDLGMGGTTPFLFWFMLGTLQAAATIERRAQKAVTPAVPAMPMRRAGAAA